MKWLIKLQLIFPILFLCSCISQSVSKIIGIKIYDYHGDYGILASKWNEMGINCAFVSASLAANDTFRQALRKRDISVFIIFPVFQNPELLKKDSTLYAITSKGLRAKDDWVEFVCPSRKQYREIKIDELSAVIRDLQPDGISIDFIRQFVFWEMIYPDRDPASIERACYCDSCMAGFSSRTGIPIPDSCKTTITKAGWIEKSYPELWNNFQCELITSTVKELSNKARTLKPDIKINFHAVPWMENEFGGANKKVAGQDLHQIAPYVDYISPMCYSQMLKRDAPWIADVVKDMDKRATGKILPSIQVYPYYIDRSFDSEDFKKCVEKALNLPSQGVVFFSWPLFLKDSSRMEVVKGVLSRKKGS